MAFLGTEVPFSVEADRLENWKDDRYTWCLFQDDFLKHVSAARNTPSLPDDNWVDWWILKITLLDAEETFDYIHEFSASTDAALKDQLPPDSTFSQVFQIVQQGYDIALHVPSLRGGLATKDYKTKLSTNRGLLSASSSGMEGICYHLYRKEHMNGTITPRPAELQQPLSVGDKLFLSEDARLQFKGLVVAFTTCTNKMKAQGETIYFDPKNGQDYVEWIWDDYHQGLGDYISAFTKNHEGGAIYYGVNEERDRSGYTVAGLELDAKEKKAIKRGICEKVRESMLWLKRDQSSGDGYIELCPADIKFKDEESHSDQDGHFHFTVNFIRVNSRPRSGPMRSSRARSRPMQRSGARSRPMQRSGASGPPKHKYILEVRVAPLDGVVFNDPEGPEAYEMQKTPEGTFEPVRLSKDEWLQKMRGYGWCSAHMRQKTRQCVQCAAAAAADG